MHNQQSIGYSLLGVADDRFELCAVELSEENKYQKDAESRLVPIVQMILCWSPRQDLAQQTVTKLEQQKLVAGKTCHVLAVQCIYIWELRLSG